MQRDKSYLIDMLNAAKQALDYVGEKNLESFLNDPQCQDAVIRRLEIIGEAASRISKETKIAFPGLPWTEMIRMRNLLIHEYEKVDPVIVWETVKADLNELIQTLEVLIKEKAF
jgi:uncharacterized protein with HEPN domain